MRSGQRRNWLLKAALMVMSVALALFGVLGWANAANAFAALSAHSMAPLDALWPLYAVAATGCVAAQIIAACAAVNFAWLTHAPKIWRALAVAFYAVCVVFAAFSADMGAQVVLSSAQRAAFEARNADRDALNAEIASLGRVIEDERRKLPSDATNIPAQRQEAALAIFDATTAAARARLPEAQRELSRKPPLPREQAQPWFIAAGVFLIFLSWAVLEPWGYALAERGRQPLAEPPTLATRPSQSAKPPWWKPLAACLSIFAISQGATPALAADAPAAKTVQSPDPVELSTFMDKKALAFSLRDRFDVREIADKVDAHPSTVYRWFAARDKALAKKESGGAARDLFATQQA